MLVRVLGLEHVQPRPRVGPVLDLVLDQIGRSRFVPVLNAECYAEKTTWTQI